MVFLGDSLSYMDIFIFLWLYWIYIIPPAALGVFMYLVRRMSFPLITRNPNELVVILSPGKAKVKKVTARYHPFFETGKGVYWFGKGLKSKVMPTVRIVKRTEKIPGQKGKLGFSKTQTVPHKKEVMHDNLASNTITIYYDGINQPIHDLQRNNTKLQKIFAHSTPMMKQVKGHAVQIPPSMLNFWHNYKLTIAGGALHIEPTREKQPYKINFFLRIGIYVEPEQQASEATELGTTSKNATATTAAIEVTKQTVIQEIGDIEKNINFSSAFSYKIVKKVRYLDRNWVRLVTGGMDMRALLIVMILAAVGVLMYLIMQQTQPTIEGLGPMPSS